MTVILYNYAGEKNRIRKTLGASKECQGELRAEADVMNPVITLKAAVSEVCGYNYAYIPEFKRWYFINNVTSFRTSLSTVSMTVDVLFTYKESIMNSIGIVVRSSKSNDGEFALPDNRFPVKQSETTHVITFSDLYSANPDPANPRGQSMILIMTGIDISS